MHILQINFESKASILQSFDSIAHKIGHDIILQVNKAKYRLVEFEFYCYAKGIFEDPYTPVSDALFTSGKFYLHGDGFGISCGNGVHHGGILLKSMIKLYEGAGQETGFMKQQYSGCEAVVTELLSNLYPLDGELTNTLKLHDIRGDNMNSLFYPAKEIIKNKRVRLQATANGEADGFKNLLARYVTVVPYFKQKMAETAAEWNCFYILYWRTTFMTLISFVRWIKYLFLSYSGK